MPGSNLWVGADNEWAYHDAHLTGLEDRNFLSSARCIIYGRRTNVGGEGQGATDAEFRKIGVVQGYNWSEQKQIEMIFELGSDIPYIIPGRTTGQISISRVLVSGADITNLFYQNADFTDGGSAIVNENWLRSLRDVTIPLDLLVAYFDQRNKASYMRQFNVCHIQSRNESLGAGQVIVAENVTIMYQNVTGYSTTPGTESSNPATTTG